MQLRQSIVAGNRLGGAPQDVFTGSLVNFYSEGHNLVGALDFSQMLVPAPWWWTLSRRHWPKPGDLGGVDAAAVLDLAGAARDPGLPSAGVEAGAPAVLWYPPAGPAIDRVPSLPYQVELTGADYTVVGATDDFLAQVLAHLRAGYADRLGPDFGADLPDPTGVTFHGPSVTWPSNPDNAPWIAFWRALEAAVGDRLGVAGLGDDFWATFQSGPLGDNVEVYTATWVSGEFTGLDLDQLGAARPTGASPDAGAVERIP
jgi:hypothetical protein